MKTNIKFILNDKIFEFPCSIELIQQIPPQKQQIANMLIQEHMYNVISRVNNSIFQSFLDYWLNKTEPEINEDTIWEFYLLSNEFGIMLDYIKSPQFEKLFNISYLIHSERNPLSNIDFTQNYDKSIIERLISSHLKEYLTTSPDKLFRIPINSLYNIFIQGVDDLEEHETAYHYIIDFAQKQRTDLYVLLNLLDGNKIKIPEVQSESFIERQNHLGFSPKNIISDEVLQQQNDQNKQLKNINDQIKIQNKKLSNNNDQLKKENDKLTREKLHLNTVNEQLQKNLEGLQLEKEMLLAENKQLNKNKLPSEITENMELNNLGPNYSIFKSLGGGSVGYVYVINNCKSSEKFAIKTSLSLLNIDRNILDYINKLLIINNPAILEIKSIHFKEASYEQSPNQKQLIITTNYMPKGSLNQVNNLLNMNQTDQYISILGIALGMQYLHSSQIVHGNLKLSNIFIDDNSFPLISDFGLSKYFKSNFLNKDSIVFVAPEILTEKIIEPNFKTDVYSYAFVVYSIITKQILKIDEPLYLFIQNIKGRRPNISNNVVKKFLQKCWSSNPSERPSFDEIIEEITSHEFVSCFQIDMKKVKNYINLFISKQPIAKPIYEKIANFIKNRTKNVSEVYNFRKNTLPKKVDDTNETQHKKKFEVALYGSSGVGKTTFINGYVKSYDTIMKTIGMDLFILKIQTENGEVKLTVFDTSGTMTYKTVSFNYLRRADAIIFFINVKWTDEINFLQNIIDEIECSNKLCYLLPTHCNEEWRITYNEILSFAKKNNLRLLKASYDDFNSIEFMFKTISNDLIGKPTVIEKEDENEKCFIH